MKDEGKTTKSEGKGQSSDSPGGSQGGWQQAGVRGRGSAAWGQPTGRQLPEDIVPTDNWLVSAQEQGGADGRLIELAGVLEARNDPLGSLGILRRQVNLSQAPIGQGDVDLHKVKEARQGAALLEAGLGLLGPGNRAPNDALLLGCSRGRRFVEVGG